jgi:hypothetical protein
MITCGSGARDKVSRHQISMDNDFLLGQRRGQWSTARSMVNSEIKIEVKIGDHAILRLIELVRGEY